jgi:serine/threonine protein kinase
MKKKYFKWNACIDQKEIESLIKLSHPNIVQLYEVILEKNILHFVFEYLDQNVYEIMKERKKLFLPLNQINKSQNFWKGINQKSNPLLPEELF